LSSEDKAKNETKKIEMPSPRRISSRRRQPRKRQKRRRI
jgi:hypothetical protein